MSQEQLLQQSVNCYQAMLEHLAILTGTLKSAEPKAISIGLAEWQKLQEEARQVDIQIEAHGEMNQEAPLAQRRIELMAEVALQCRQIYSQASLLKALVSDELHRLQQGRMALGGYKGKRDHRGSRLTASL